MAALIPGGIRLVQRRARATGRNGLVLLRGIFLSFVTSLIIIEAVVVLISATYRTKHVVMSADVFLVVLAGWGIIALIVPRYIEKPLDCGADAALATTYRLRFFLRLAFAQSVALVGFVGFIVTDHAWLYPVGLAFTAAGMARLAPTRRNLAKDQEDLRQSGCAQPLVGALATIPPRSSR